MELSPRSPAWALKDRGAVILYLIFSGSRRNRLHCISLSLSLSLSLSPSRSLARSLFLVLSVRLNFYDGADSAPDRRRIDPTREDSRNAERKLDSGVDRSARTWAPGDGSEGEGRRERTEGKFDSVDLNGEAEGGVAKPGEGGDRYSTSCI